MLRCIMALLLNTVLLLCLSLTWADDYYELLGLNKDADNRDIRRAFKKLALKMHPDKNPNDENAHENFIKINKAYEVLKDEEMRKKYDLYGEEGLKDDFGKSWKGSYQSWNYYYESFGIYDDDPEIITLSRSDFEQSVVNSPDRWFINFYSPQCSHCHILAPSWREMARELEGVIRIGAVNCEEDWMLCRQQNIHSYPSLIFYPEKEKYKGSRETEDLVNFVLKKLPNKIIKLNIQDVKNEDFRQDFQTHSWLIFVCKKDWNCIFEDIIEKLSIILDGLVNVALVNVHEKDSLCNSINCNSAVAYYKSQTQLNNKMKGEVIDETELKPILNAVLKLLPSAEEITDKKFEEIREALKSETTQPWLLEFAKDMNSIDSSQNTELKRLQAFLPNVKLGTIDCEKYRSLCSKWSLNKFPVFIILKPGGDYEFHHGRFTAHDIATFVRESLSSNVAVLTPEKFPSVTVDTNPWFIDFFAPWCPPCMQLLPEFRKASRNVGHLAKFGTVDCTIHTALCTKYNIRSYPTTILYNQSVPHEFHGRHSQKSLEDFVEDTIHPKVINLNSNTFDELVVKKPKGVMWVIDFFAPWCSPCQQLSPEWRKLAKMLKHESTINIGQVDCTTQSKLCSEQNVNSYPTIRLYPKEKKGASKFYLFNGWNRDAHSLQAWVHSYLPSDVLSLGSFEFDEILVDPKPWVIDFYAPWCSHCQTFAPEFEKVAKASKGKINTGKINCEQLPELCRTAGVRAYPTVMLYSGKKGGKKQNPIGDKINAFTFEEVASSLQNKIGIKLKSPFVRDEL